MENLTATAPEALKERVHRLRDGIAELIGETDRTGDALVAAGITNLFGDDLEAALQDALEDVDVLLDLDCDPDIYRYWFWRVHLCSGLDEVRQDMDAAAWARFMAVHERFEARFPELAREVARAAARNALMVARDERLERRAFRALDLMAEGAA